MDPCLLTLAHAQNEIPLRQNSVHLLIDNSRLPFRRGLELQAQRGKSIANFWKGEKVSDTFNPLFTSPIYLSCSFRNSFVKFHAASAACASWCLADGFVKPCLAS